jgi:hypothetical protein
MPFVDALKTQGKITSLKMTKVVREKKGVNKCVLSFKFRCVYFHVFSQ